MPPTQRGRAPAYPEFFGLLPTPNQFDLEQQNLVWQEHVAWGSAVSPVPKFRPSYPAFQGHLIDMDQPATYDLILVIL